MLLKKDGIRLLIALSMLGILSINTSSTNNTPSFIHTGTVQAHEKISPRNVDSSVKIPADTLTQAINEARNAFNRILAPYAKITMDQAHKIAQDSQPHATVKELSLQTIRQNLVYVAILTQGEMRQLTVIDAGNGKILATRTLNVHHRMHEHERSNLMY